VHVSAVRVFVVKGLLLLQITIFYDDFLESFKYFRPLFQSQNPESGRRSIPGFRDPKCCPDRNPIVAVRPPPMAQCNCPLWQHWIISFPCSFVPGNKTTTRWTFVPWNERVDVSFSERNCLVSSSSNFRALERTIECRKRVTCSTGGG